MDQNFLLPAAVIAENLSRLSGAWQNQNDQKIIGQFVFVDFAAAMKFVNQVAALADQQDHHPQITIDYHKVVLTLWTHAAGGLTGKDFTLIQAIENLF